MYNNELLEAVDTFKYLGIVFRRLGKLHAERLLIKVTVRCSILFVKQQR